jgi:hypothetical protein
MGPGVEFINHVDTVINNTRVSPSDTESANNALSLCGTEYIVQDKVI